MSNILTCRACLVSKGNNFVSICEKKNLQRFQICAGLKVQKNDKLPKYLCNNCTMKIESFFEFRELCQRSAAAWNNLFSSVPKKITTNEIKTEIEDNKVCLEMLPDDKSIIIDDIDDVHKYHDTEVSYYNDDNDDVYLINNMKDDDDFNNVYQPDYLDSDEHQDTKESFENQKKVSKIVKRGRPRKIKETLTIPKKSTFKGQCNRCNKFYYYKSRLIKHVEVCGRPLIDFPKKTIISKDKKVNLIEALFCGICDKDTKEPDEIAAHLKEHEQSNDLNCKLCDHKAIDFADLVCHRYEHQPKTFQSKIFKCYICSRYRFAAHGLEYHIRGVHINKTGKGGLCRQCGRGPMNYRNWKTHVQKHMGLVFPCDLCPAKFRTNKGMLGHKRTTHRNKSRFICDVCGFSTNKAGNLRSHIYHKHTTHTQVQCNVCGKYLKNEDVLRRHKAVTCGERSIECSVCGKFFATPNELKKHMIWHSDARPFKCNLCTKSYKKKQVLVEHKRAHTGETPYLCTNCGTSFATRNSWKRHMTLHSGILHKCIECHKTFSSENALKRHGKTHIITIKAIA